MCVSFLLGAVRSRLTGILDESEFAATLLLLRGLNVVLSVATVAIIGGIGKRGYGPAGGLTAAAPLACFPNHVLSSHYARMRRVAPPEWGSSPSHQIPCAVEKLRDSVDADCT